MITGSNGKSTTTALIGHLLSALGLDVMVGGNIGIPFIDLVAPLLDNSLNELHLPGVFVIEASSYQLEQSVSFVPHVGVFLNLSENHLERHGTLTSYFAAKSSPFLRQSPEDFAILNSQDVWCRQLLAETRAKVFLFGEEHAKQTKEDSHLDACVIYQPDRALDWIDLKGNDRVELEGVKLPGRHNRDNLAAALLAVSCFRFDPILVREALLSFEGLPHRMQIVSTRQPVIWINDSKSTTVTSSQVALEAVVESYPKKQIILLLGGLLKSGSQWEPLFKLMADLKERLRMLIVFGAGAPELSRYAQNEDLMSVSATSVAEAVQRAYVLACSGDVVLFSPGAASFDEFRDFEHRGAYFSQLVKDQELDDAAEQKSSATTYR
jgi:UDP-N-acetylmuramoylalanine--D-glutamate ligase